MTVMSGSRKIRSDFVVYSLSSRYETVGLAEADEGATFQQHRTCMSKSFIYSCFTFRQEQVLKVVEPTARNGTDISSKISLRVFIRKLARRSGVIQMSASSITRPTQC
ncbi:hypothetical protein GQ600_1846 [Phytophthora cactorum]|nr:hypothetical protein GQ600_1846 [Phytophthora cactorum]